METLTRSTTSHSTVSRIHISLPEERDGRIYWEGELQLPSGQSFRIYFNFTAPASRPDLLPGHGRSCLHFWCRRCRPARRWSWICRLTPSLEIISWSGRSATWWLASPKVLKVVPIVAPLDAQPVPAREPGAITAFSGGVDSNFTVWRHCQRLESPKFRTTSLRAGLMIHGFDIPLSQEGVFESAWQRSCAMLEASGLQAFRLATNLRSMDKLPGCDWGNNTHGIWIAAALSCYEPWFGQMLIPSTYTYPMLSLPWGSNPITDPLFSSATTTYWHDGASHSKLTKVQAIAGQKIIRRHLRVCWEGKQLDRNCGNCFKCITTQICFQLAGHARLDAFPEPCSLAEVANVPVKNEQNAWLLGVMSAEAKRLGLDQVVRALDHALAKAAAKKRRVKIKQRLKQWTRFRFQ